MRVRDARRTNPCLDIAELTLPGPTDLVGQQALLLDPTRDRLCSDHEVYRHRVDCAPGFGHETFLPRTQSSFLFF
jgi:hypothetical protein